MLRNRASLAAPAGASNNTEPAALKLDTSLEPRSLETAPRKPRWSTLQSLGPRSQAALTHCRAANVAIATGEIKRMQNGRAERGSSSLGCSSNDSLKTLLPSSLV